MVKVAVRVRVMVGAVVEVRAGPGGGLHHRPAGEQNRSQVWPIWFSLLPFFFLFCRFTFVFVTAPAYFMPFSVLLTSD